MSREEEIRQTLWLGHGCQGLYGDDGEMQCGACCIDFKRDSFQRIAKLIRARPNEWEKVLTEAAEKLMEQARIYSAGGANPAIAGAYIAAASIVGGMK